MLLKKDPKNTKAIIVCNTLLFFFFGCIRGMWKFPGQGLVL